MSNISNLGDAYNWSVAKIAEAFGLNRGTVKKRLLDANTPIANMVRGNPVYALRDIGPILFGADPDANTSSLQDPSLMPPKDRKDWFQSENERIKLETTLKQLVPVADVHLEMAVLVNLKAASPIIRVFADHVDPNEEAEGVTLKKLHTGIYQLHGVLGLHSDASWGGINGGITIPCGINQLPLVYALYDVLEKGKPHPFDGRIVEPDEDGDIVLYTTYRKHDLPQNIQYERFKLYPEFLKEVDGEKVELTPGEPCDIPNGHWVDVRVNMPSNSIYNQKQAEAERLAKIEAERLKKEEAKRAAEEAERAEQEAAESQSLDDKF